MCGGRDHYPEKQYLPTTAGNSQSQPHISCMRTECCLPKGIETPTSDALPDLPPQEQRRKREQFTYESKQLWSKLTWRCVNHISQSLTETRGNLPGRATYSRPKIINSTKKWTWLKNKCTIVLRVMWCSLQVISKSLCLKHEFLH